MLNTLKPRKRRVLGLTGQEIAGLGALLFIAAVIVLTVLSIVLNLPGFTKERATGNAYVWLKENSKQGTASCVHDSDGDGYASCTVRTTVGERAQLQCVSGFGASFFGSSGCKEVDSRLQFNNPIPR